MTTRVTNHIQLCSAHISNAALAQQRSGSFRTARVRFVCIIYTKYEAPHIIQHSRKKEGHTQLSSSHAAAQRSAAPCGAVLCCAVLSFLFRTYQNNLYVHIIRACGVGVVFLEHGALGHLFASRLFAPKLLDRLSVAFHFSL